MTLLTLVENAVRHGIDPGEEGGRIDVGCFRARRPMQRSRHRHGRGPRIERARARLGLASLRERLQLAFGGDAELRLEPVQPQGARASLDFPARREAA